MEGFVNIQNKDGLVRDLSSGAVINTNRTEREIFLQKRNASKELKQQIKQNSDKIEKIESDVTEIKEMLAMLIKGKQ
jgi:nitrate/TMAO reductase-like tetraheme cytochrome c subunit